MMGWWELVSSCILWLPWGLVLLCGPAARGYGGIIALQADAPHPWPRGSNSRHVRSYHHLEGDIRRRRLYSSTQFFLCVDSNGKVKGTRWKDCPNSIVEIRSVQVGVVAIRSIQSGFYLAMNRKGKIYGTKAYSANCKFQERIEENGYNTYASLTWLHKGRPMFLSLNTKGVPQRGTKTRREDLATHFLLMLIS